tara:strand:- start:252 stop:719 length:468 start_codon:yes stop_codon:yes gene_type:complete
MLKALIILPVLFSLWFGLVKIFSTNKEPTINVLSKKVFNDFNLVFRNILDILDSLFKSFIQIYELLGLILKNIVVIFKSLSSTFGQFINLLKVVGITLMSIISLCKGLYDETRNITLFNSFEAILNQTKSAKNNVVRLFAVKGDELNNKEVTLEN